jgi:hypothetical protein
MGFEQLGTRNSDLSVLASALGRSSEKGHQINGQKPREHRIAPVNNFRGMSRRHLSLVGLADRCVFHLVSCHSVTRERKAPFVCQQYPTMLEFSESHNMGAIMPTNVSIDLSNASDADLQSIKNEVLARLASRASAGATKVAASDGYDRHGSGHSRSTPPKLAATAE